MKAVVMPTPPSRIVLAGWLLVLGASFLAVLGTPFLAAQGPLSESPLSESPLNQGPLAFPENVADESLQEVVVPLSDAVKRRITEALRKEAQAGGRGDVPPPSSGDPILDDVLDVIRRQGSVLDGSLLDVPPDELSGRAELPSRTPLRFSDSAIPIPESAPPVPGYAGEDRGGIAGDARFHTAESLLRAARKLSSLPGGDINRSRLIAAMREQATVLLIDEFSQDSSRVD
jgi:hypothetical protein